MKENELMIRNKMYAFVVVLVFMCLASVFCLFIRPAVSAESTGVTATSGADNTTIPYKDPDGTRLWQSFLNKVGSEEQIKSPLMDKVSYFDEQNGGVVVGPYDDAYLYYRDREYSIKLNDNYKIDGTAIKDCKQDINYTVTNLTNPDNGATGEYGKLNKISVKAIVTLKEGYTVYGQRYFELTKECYIVTANNNLRYYTGADIAKNVNIAGSWKFGSNSTAQPMRPEHGETVIYTYRKKGSTTTVGQFAAGYRNGYTGVTYYEVKIDSRGKTQIDMSKPMSDDNYFQTFNKRLRPGEYDLEVCIPEYRVDISESSHGHWWETSTSTSHEASGVKFYESVRVFEIQVNTYSISAGSEPNAGITWQCLTPTVPYNGKKNNTPKINISLNGIELNEGKDYELLSEDIDVGSADLTIRGITLSGEIKSLGAFRIEKGENSWVEDPFITSWRYGYYDDKINVFSAVPAIAGSESTMWFKIATDTAGNNIVPGFGRIKLENDGKVKQEVIDKLNVLSTGKYRLFATIDGTTNYYTLESGSCAFTVYGSDNYWIQPPMIKSWTEGSYDADENAVKIQSRFGKENIVIVIRDIDNNIVYDPANNVNLLADAKAGLYVLTASVVGNDNYGYLDAPPYLFRVFDKPGMQWWAVLCIVLGSLAVAALIIFIMWKKGVFQILTGKLVIAIRTKATVDALVAAVRATKIAEESRRAIEEAAALAQHEEQSRARHEALLAERAKPMEEKALALESKAKVAVERAERIRARAEVMQARAARMREQVAAETGLMPPESTNPDAAHSADSKTPTEK